MNDRQAYMIYIEEFEKTAKSFGKDEMVLENNHWSRILSFSNPSKITPEKRDEQFKLMKESLLEDLNIPDKTQHRYSYQLSGTSMYALIHLIEKAPLLGISPAQCAHIYNTISARPEVYLELLNKLSIGQKDDRYSDYFLTILSQNVISEDYVRVFSSAIHSLETLQKNLPENKKISQEKILNALVKLYENNPNINEKLNTLSLMSSIKLVLDENHLVSFMKICRADNLERPLISFSDFKTYTMELSYEQMVLNYEIKSVKHFKDIIKVMDRCFSDPQLLSDINARAVDFSSTETENTQNIYIQAQKDDRVNFQLISDLMTHCLDNAKRIGFSYTEKKEDEQRQMQWNRDIFFEDYLKIKLDNQLPINQNKPKSVKI